MGGEPVLHVPLELVDQSLSRLRAGPQDDMRDDDLAAQFVGRGGHGGLGDGRLLLQRALHVRGFRRVGLAPGAATTVTFGSAQRISVTGPTPRAASSSSSPERPGSP